MKKMIVLISLCLLASPGMTKPVTTPFSQQRAVKDFIQEMSKKHGMDSRTLSHYFSQFTPEEKVLKLMSKQSEALPWYRYRSLVITDSRIEEGVRFWKKHQKTLNKIHKQTGVEPAVIVSILGIETHYGKILGKYPVLQSLSTLAFHYPRRSAFFKKELEQFLLLTEEGALDPIHTMGSFAGAMGMPQFMPSSYNRFAIDFSKKGKRDLIENIDDILGSVANYLAKNGWQPHQPVVWDPPTSLLSSFSKSQDLPVLKSSQALLKAYQQQKLPKTRKIKVIVLKGKDRTQKLIGLPNFYAIMHYNNSVHYAMAVHVLSQKMTQRLSGHL